MTDIDAARLREMSDEGLGMAELSMAFGIAEADVARVLSAPPPRPALPAFRIVPASCFGMPRWAVVDPAGFPVGATYGHKIDAVLSALRLQMAAIGDARA